MSDLSHVHFMGLHKKQTTKKDLATGQSCKQSCTVWRPPGKLSLPPGVSLEKRIRLDKAQLEAAPNPLSVWQSPSIYTKWSQDPTNNLVRGKFGTHFVSVSFIFIVLPTNVI